MSLPSLPIGPGDIEWVVKHFRDWKFNWSWKKAIEAQAKAKMNPRTYRFLEHVYQRHPIFTIGKMPFPTIMMRAPESQWDQPESVLAHPLEAEVQDFDDLRGKGAKHLERLEKLSKVIVREKDGKEHPLLRLYDGIGYRMLSMRTLGSLQLHCCTGRYYDQICTCDSLRWELLTTVGHSRPEEVKQHEELLRRLKLRSLAHKKSAGNPIVDGHGRCAEIGISTLIVYNDGNGYSTLIRERSKQVAVYRDDFHVVPSFMFESEVGDISNEYSVRHNVFREYLEEVFNKRELENPPTAAAFDWFYEYPDLQFLFELLDNRDDAELLLTGIAVDLFNLRPEILTLLLIKTPVWWNNHRRGNRERQLSPVVVNYEFKTPRELSKERHDLSVPVKLDEALEPRLMDLPRWINLTDPGIWVPPGAAAFYLGLEVAKKRLGYSP